MNCDGNTGESSEEGGGDRGEEGGKYDHVTTVNMDDWETWCSFVSQTFMSE